MSLSWQVVDWVSIPESRKMAQLMSLARKCRRDKNCPDYFPKSGQVWASQVPGIGSIFHMYMYSTCNVVVVKINQQIGQQPLLSLKTGRLLFFCRTAVLRIESVSVSTQLVFQMVSHLGLYEGLSSPLARSFDYSEHFFWPVEQPCLQCIQPLTVILKLLRWLSEFMNSSQNRILTFDYMW